MAYIRTAGYTIEELDAVLKKAQKGKFPGPDEFPMDQLKAMSRENRIAVLKIIDTVRNEPQYLAELLCKANIVTIFNKLSVEDSGNDRPIALLQSVCTRRYSGTD